jgi:hypothetical protein
MEKSSKAFNRPARTKPLKPYFFDSLNHAMQLTAPLSHGCCLRSRRAFAPL